MDLRPRLRQSFSGFTKAEVEKMEQLIDDFKEQTLEDEFCKKLARLFNRSSGRAGKPVVKWTEVQSWFQKNQQIRREASFDGAKKLPVVPETHTQNKASANPRMPEGGEDVDMSRLEFEARSSKDGAWYDVGMFRSHRFLSSGEAEVLVRYVGFGSDEDEWVKVRDSVRVRSVALEHTECRKVKVGDLVVCYQLKLVEFIESFLVETTCTHRDLCEQERQDQARYYDAHVLEIQKRWHDMRGCRCLFLIKYDHDNTEERVRLRRLCCRPTIGTKSK